MTADFLDIPVRPGKPRTAGLTHLLDKGVPIRHLQDLLDTIGPAADIWKFGWGTAYLDPHVRKKVDVLGQHDIRSCIGGTLLEIAWLQGRAAVCLDWADDLRFPHVEVSDGAVPMQRADKRRLIADATRRFEVLAEVGSKDPTQRASADEWATAAKEDLDAGAERIIAEGRESGTVGLYEPDGTVRADVAHALVEAVGLDRVIFEAPRKEQQVWFLLEFGPDVGLGNVPPKESLGLEALRLGLRADTVPLLSRPVHH